jgi:hypothetical protein
MMSEVQAVEGAGEAGSTGGEGAELTNALTGAAGADQGGQGVGEGGAGEADGAGEGGSQGVAEGEGGEGGTGGQGAARSEDPVNKRFSEVTKQRDEAQRREREARDQLTAALEALKRAGGGEKPATPTVAPSEPADDIGPEPVPPVFEDPDQYQRDMAQYAQKLAARTAKLEFRAAEAKRQTEEKEAANRQAQQAHAQAWQARRAAALQEMPDYAEVAENPNVPVSQPMAIAITSSEHGPKIAYHLGQHPEVAERIAKMSPALQLMELGKLEAQITAPKPVRTSKAPEPIRHQTGSGSPQTKSVEDMSMDEYAASRSKH